MNTITIICSGFHDFKLTYSFLEALAPFSKEKLLEKWLIFPTSKYLPYSSLKIVEFLSKTQGNPKQAKPIFFIAFSAGVVGAIGAAHLWQLSGGKVKGFIALDGWGVPLIANFPIYRVSHDYFTHFSSNFLEFNRHSFYCQPSVSHLDLWRSPHKAIGWWEKAPGCKIKISAAEFIKSIALRAREEERGKREK
jgi:hypothetical protein